MKAEAAMAAEKEEGDKDWASGQIYPTRFWTGSVYCPHKCLLDSLNSVFTSDGEFVVLGGASMSNQDGNGAMLPLAYINKANILSVREVEEGQTRGLGGEAGHKLYPFVPELSVAAKVYIPFYILNGLLHFPRG